LPYLTHLVHLSLISLTLKVDQFSHTGSPENVVTTTNPFFKPQPAEEFPQLIEVDIRIGPPSEDPNSELAQPAHKH
jgi:hypothetical protein